MTNHNFVSEDNQWKLNLTKDFIALSTLHYPGWEEFARQLDKPLAAFIRLYKPAYFQRVGLRYVNIFSRARLGLEGARWAELFSPAYTAPMQEAELPEDRFLNCACDLTLKLDSSCQAKVHAGPGVVKRNAPGVPQDPEVKFIFDMDLSMTGNTPAPWPPVRWRRSTATPPACLKVLSPTGSGTPWRPDNLRKSPGDVYGRLPGFLYMLSLLEHGSGEIPLAAVR